MSRISEEQKREIVQLYKQGAKVTAIAQKMGSTKNCVCNIISTWIEYGENAVAETEKEPAEAATSTSSEQNNLTNNSADIIPQADENVKSQTIPNAVEEACLDKIDYLKKEIAAEQAVIDDWKAQIAEINEFLKSFDYEVQQVSI